MVDARIVSEIQKKFKIIGRTEELNFFIHYLKTNKKTSRYKSVVTKSF